MGHGTTTEPDRSHERSRRPLPSGQVTFVFTDVVGSTRAFADHGQAYVDALVPLQRAVARHAEAAGGAVVKTEGDGAFLAFPSADSAQEAIVGLQAELEDGAADTVLRLHLRAGGHTGPAEPIDDDYLAFAVHVAARVSGTANAGQFLVSQAFVDALSSPAGDAVGDFELKDIDGPVTLWRIVGDDEPPRAPPVRRTNVAVARTSFIGRADELEQLRLATAVPGVVTLHGAGGIGKTRLVSEHALRVASTIPSGAWLVELATLDASGGVESAVAATLGLSGSSTRAVILDEVARRGEMLLILDNCEHVVDDVAELVVELVDHCPQLRVLCTSREALLVEGEKVINLVPLGTMAPAQQLFLARAEDAGADVADFDLDTVSELCDLLDGLPLAVELAAKQSASRPLKDLLEGIQAGHVDLRRRGGQERQQSLDGLVGWSLGLLDGPSTRSLLALTVFPGRFSSSMAAEVLQKVQGADAHAAANLARLSLVDLDGDDYRLLFTIRQVCRGRLVADDELDHAAQSALFSWAVANAPTAAGELTGIPLDQIRASEEALLWAYPRGLEGVGRVMRHLANAFLTRGSGPRTRALVEDIARGSVEDSPDGLALAAGAYKLLAGLGHNESIEPDAVAHLTARAKGTADEDVYIDLLSITALALDRNGRHAESAPLHDELIELAEASGNVPLLMAELANTGVSYHLAGDLPTAESYYRQAIDRDGDDVNVHIARANLGELMIDGGRFDEAVEHLRRTVTAGRAAPTIAGVALCLLTEAEVKRGSFHNARVIQRQAERELAHIMETDPSLAYVEERLKAAVALIPDLV